MDARFIGTPIDYVVFEGLAEQDPREIVFIDVKTGRTATLTPIQQKIKQVIDQKRVRWETIHIGALEEKII
jgi:predicted Holliday junction resolvase-like endonuclease